MRSRVKRRAGHPPAFAGSNLALSLRSERRPRAWWCGTTPQGDDSAGISAGTEILTSSIGPPPSTGGQDDESYDRIWSVLEGLRPFGRVAFDAAVTRLGSDDPSVRATACDVLTALCNPDNDGWSADKGAAVLALAEHEDDDDVLWSIVAALPFTDAEAFMGTRAHLGIGRCEKGQVTIPRPSGRVRHRRGIAVEFERGDDGIILRRVEGRGVPRKTIAGRLVAEVMWDDDGRDHGAHAGGCGPVHGTSSTRTSSSMC